MFNHRSEYFPSPEKTGRDIATGNILTFVRGGVLAVLRSLSLMFIPVVLSMHLTCRKRATRV